jgi:hypothetical protein
LCAKCRHLPPFILRPNGFKLKAMSGSIKYNPNEISPQK